MKKDPKYIENNKNKQIELSRPYYGIYRGDKNNCYLPVPNPDSYKLNQKLYSKVPVNTHYFGNVLFYPVLHLDKEYNNNINYANLNASKGPYFATNNVTPVSYSTNYGKKSTKSKKKVKK